MHVYPKIHFLFKYVARVPFLYGLLLYVSYLFVQSLPDRYIYFLYLGPIKNKFRPSNHFNCIECAYTPRENRNTIKI